MLTNSKTFNTISKQQLDINPQPLDYASIQHDQFSFYYGFSQLPNALNESFQDIINELNIFENINLILNGYPWNISEDQSVGHHHCRHPNPPEWVLNEKEKWHRFTKSKTHQYTHVIQVGIGGSALGPKALIEALKYKYTPKVTPLFLSSVSDYEIQKTLNQVNLDKTLFIIASKSGTTSEIHHILSKIQTIWCATNRSLDQLKACCISITTSKSPLDDLTRFSHCFYIDPTVGGRFSLTSAMGGVITSLVYSPECFELVLNGCYALDPVSLPNMATKNAPLLNACLSIFFRNLCHYNSIGIISYSPHLSYFNDFIKQLICESNGKQHTAKNQILPYKTAPAVITDTGTHAQHAIFQQFYQSADITPITFIGVSHEVELNKHLCAQAVALKTQHRPCTILMLDRLDAFRIGQLIGFYENSVLYEGLLWGINSFDQPGVALGKQLLSNQDSKVQELFKQITKKISD
jgi:glucose-6-phosphate isomerase